METLFGYLPESDTGPWPSGRNRSREVGLAGSDAFGPVLVSVFAGIPEETVELRKTHTSPLVRGQ